MAAPNFNIYAPLQEFRWSGGSFEHSPGVWIRRRADMPDLQIWDQRLDVDEQDRIFLAEHWLTFSRTETAENKPAEAMNLAAIQSNTRTDALEGDDAQRRAFFQELKKNWSPPKSKSAP